MNAPPEILALLNKMSRALDERQVSVEDAEDWYEGRHPIPDPPKGTFAAVDVEARSAFTNLAELGVTNFLPPVVDVPARKTRVEGFRFSETDKSTDKIAWAIWQRNHLDEDSDLLIHTAVKTGQAFATVWRDMNGQAQIDVEDPSQAIVAYESGSRRRRRAGLKRWIDDDGYILATLYLPDAIWKFRSAMPTTSNLVLPLTTARRVHGVQVWEAREVPGELWPLPNPLGEVNLVEVRCNATMKAQPYGGGRPFFERQINEQRRINQTVLNMLTTMEHQAFRQRWVIGWEPPTNEDGTVDKHQLLKASAASLGLFNNPDGANESIKVGEFAQSDFRPFLEAIVAWVKVIASTSGTPPYAFLLGDMINVAADSIARIDGVAKANVMMLQRATGGGLREVMRLALRVEEDPRADDPAMSPVWAEPEERTATEQAELAVTMNALGAPLEDVFAALPGVTQQEASRWAQRAAGQELIRQVLAGQPDEEPEPAQPEQ